MTVENNTSGNAVVDQEECSTTSAGAGCAFRLWDYESDRFISVTFMASAVEGLIDVVLDLKELRLELEDKLCLAPSKSFADFSMTAFSGRCIVGSLTGTVLVVVNCGQVVPTLQISLLVPPAGLQSWCLRMDHAVQSRVLQELSTMEMSGKRPGNSSETGFAA